MYGTQVSMVFPPVLGHVSSGILPGLEAIVFHDQKPDSNAIPRGGSTSAEREMDFDIYIKRNLDIRYFHKLPDYIVQHVQTHGFLNCHKIEEIIEAIVPLEEETDDIRKLDYKTQTMLVYVQTMLRSEDPKVIAQREILKSQEKLSGKLYKCLKCKLQEYQDDTGLLWALMAQEIKHTCDVEDAATAANGAEPDAAAPPYTHTPHGTGLSGGLGS
ncbi:uncharacterized protein MELLADRAFT_69423 [Melampsora larici-populina 98AG31]|uniref:Uncharacterized protein n=1 Tax=Melampsora larici-populina (strain 98AG31 / pathotype 3-4-7) TaxID=747676 RepID=F4SAP6_MELLP|nr:uncharacterized protein MELLADRAFT_69423 [Melampsora larici-populina 98AG31]EGF98254.1 hypothetical protein MELLADRAFT_69423 [Melampsora larici-populina 98AG31]